MFIKSKSSDSFDIIGFVYYGLGKQLRSLFLLGCMEQINKATGRHVKFKVKVCVRLKVCC